MLVSTDAGGEGIKTFRVLMNDRLGYPLVFGATRATLGRLHRIGQKKRPSTSTIWWHLRPVKAACKK